jgi:hypothetical protein
MLGDAMGYFSQQTSQISRKVAVLCNYHAGSLGR